MKNKQKRIFQMFFIYVTKLKKPSKPNTKNPTKHTHPPQETQTKPKNP